MQKLTLEYINSVTPEHGRTSCSDTNRENGYFRIKEETLRGVVVKRMFEVAPRCSRCLLLELKRQQEEGIALDIELEFDVSIRLKQPEFEIKQK